MQDNKIKDTFLNNLRFYKRMTGNDYSATQMAAIATESDLGISNEQLRKSLKVKNNG